MMPMLAVLLALQGFVVAPADSALLSGDTLRLEPVGVRMTVPAFWMRRAPAGVNASLRDAGRFMCQALDPSPIDERVVADRAKLAERPRLRHSSGYAFEATLDSIVARPALVAHVGGVPYGSSCLAPHVLIYVLGAGAVDTSWIATIALREAERQSSGAKSTRADSAGWSIVRLAWTDATTDFIRPATVELRYRQFGKRLVLLGLLDAWAGKDDVDALLGSIR